MPYRKSVPKTEYLVALTGPDPALKPPASVGAYGSVAQW
jgi:hypothetical protein